MKKRIVLCLAMLILLSLTLAGCTSEDIGSEAQADAVVTDVPESVEDTAKSVKERLEAGEEVLVGYSVNTLSNPALKQTIDNVSGFLEEMGCTVSVAACEGDTALMISQVENFIEMKVDMIIVAPIDQDAMEDTLMKAVEAGIPVVFNGQYPTVSV